MEVLGISRLGTRVADHEAVVAFFSGVLGLPAHRLDEDVTVLEVPGAASLEVFGPRRADNRHLTHPVVGFRVADLPSALAELEAAGTEVVLPMQEAGGGSWLHFRATDGFVYELTQRDPRQEA